MAILIRDKQSEISNIEEYSILQNFDLSEFEVDTSCFLKKDKKTLTINVAAIKNNPPKLMGVVFKAINVEYGIEKVIFEGNKQITFFDRNTGGYYLAKPMSFDNLSDKFIEIHALYDFKKLTGNLFVEPDITARFNIDHTNKHIEVDVVRFQRLSKKYKNTGSTYRCLYSNIHFLNNTYQMLKKYSLNSKSKKCLYDILEDNVLYRFDFSNGILYLIKNPTLKHYYMQDYSHKNVEWYLGSGHEMEDGREYYMYFLER